ncbi:MAG: hypothetical protein AB8B64_00910 [Granulosicoccus sp.]
MHRLLLILMLLTGSAIADDIGTPSGEVLLTISGNITITNSENGAEFDLDMLEKLGAFTITTDTPWTDSGTEFSGVRLDILLKAVGAQSSAIRAMAMNSYWYDIDKLDFEKYPVVLAYLLDGEYMNARTLGPLWIMFPFSDFPELLTEQNKAACVWQVNSLIVL